MADTSKRSASGHGALAGLRVLDLSRVLAGPLCTQMLSDHGAQVVKIEPPRGDETRTLGPPFNDDGDAAYFTAVNRGKQAMSLDLSQPEGRETLLALLGDADILIENFIPGTMQRWGLDYEDELRPRFPRLIYCAVSGFGGDGPLGGLPGYDAVLQAMCGLMSVNGDDDSGPTRIGVPIVDHVTGYTALTGILLALHERQRSGLGQRVEATLFDTALSLLVPHAANWMYSGQAPQLLGSAHPNIAPYDKFQCRDGLVFLGIVNDRQFEKFCGLMSLPALATDARFANNAQRLRHRDALRQEIEAALSDWSRADVCARLMQGGVPAGPVHSVPEAFSQPHATHRGMTVESGAYRGIGIPVRLSRTPGRPGAHPPRFGQHAQRILQEAGLDPPTGPACATEKAAPLGCATD
ncbi:CoA transferase [Variovorax dokdonensis]|uniref:CoA transferase n=1 Tax=Variovorax dokdonensis TaxID=344883 RepID=A0ABT7N4T6_9BURK|nr:CoA transferase [Variovorax dokdonensis]MDM0042922.1 CoA transferase [Variovorax dokdonensis]